MKNITDEWMHLKSNNSFNISQKPTTPSSSYGTDACKLPLVHGVPIFTINYILAVVGTCGNILVICAILSTPKLRHKISNFLLLSLAITDLLVTMCAQPLHATSVAFRTILHSCVPKIDLSYDVVGNFSCFCSIFHLVAISIDRVLLVTKPHKHSTLMKKYGLKLMLSICWGLATVFVCVRVPFGSTLVLSMVLILLTYLIIIVSYAVIFYQVSKKLNRNTDSAITFVSQDWQADRRVAKAIAIIILFFFISWFPLLGFYISIGSGVLRNIQGVTYMWIRTVTLSNSSINFAVYSWRINDFRVAYLRIINRIVRWMGLRRHELSTISHHPKKYIQSENNAIREDAGKMFQSSVVFSNKMGGEIISEVKNNLSVASAVV